MKDKIIFGLCLVLLTVSVFAMSLTSLEMQSQEMQSEKDLARLFYILRAAEQRHAGYLAYDVPQADPFSRAQRVEYFTACGYVVVAEGREGHFIVKRVELITDSTEENRP